MSVAPSPSDRIPRLSTEWLAYYRWISDQSLTIVDVETTGSIARRDRVIEISVLQASLTDGVQHQQTCLINPNVRVPEKITQFTGITQEMVDRGTPAPSVWLEFFPRLNQGILTAHNLSFDYSFLKSEYKRLGMTYDRPPVAQLCTVILSRLLLSHLPSRSLPKLVEHFGFQVGQSHRAEADTLACWLLAEKLLTEIQTESDDHLLQRFGKQWLDLKDAADILKCTPKQARSRLEEAQVPARVVREGVTVLYQRRDVEDFFLAQKQKYEQYNH